MPTSRVRRSRRLTPAIVVLLLFGATAAPNARAPASASASTVVTVDDQYLASFNELELKFACWPGFEGDYTFRFSPTDPRLRAGTKVLVNPQAGGDCTVREYGTVGSAGQLVEGGWTPAKHLGSMDIMEPDRWAKYAYFGLFGGKTGSVTIIFSDVTPVTYSIAPSSQTIIGTAFSPIESSEALIPDGFSGDPTFSASGLPSGLVIDPETGVISGTPDDLFSTQNVTITASNGTEVATATVTITINGFLVDFDTQGNLDNTVGTTPSTLNVRPGESGVLPATSGLASNHLFGGWFTEQVGGESAGMPGDPYFPAQSLTLYARWLPSVRIQYNLDGGALPDGLTTMSPFFPQGTDFTLPLPSRGGRVFNGWYTQATGGVLRGFGGDTIVLPTIAPGSTIQAYARWRSPFTHWFRPNGGALDGVTCDAGTSPLTENACRITEDPAGTVLPEAVRTGHRFDGWWSSTTGGTFYGNGGEIARTALPSGGFVEARWTAFALQPLTATLSATLHTTISPWTVAAVGFTAVPGSFSIAPALPGGLMFDASNGTISGTPTEVKETAAYTITATGPEGPVTATVDIAVGRPAPGAPRDLAATAGNGRVTLSWSPPSNASDASIPTYTATGTALGESPVTCVTSTTSCAIAGLRNGTAYDFTVAVTGSDATSNTIVVTPVAPPTSWIPTPERQQPRVDPARAELQAEDGTPVPLTVTSPAPGRLALTTPVGVASMTTVTFTGAPTSSVETGLVVTDEGTVRCEICAAIAEGTVVEIWAFSTPRLVATAAADRNGCIDAMLPLAAPLDGAGPIPAGQHTLQVVLPMADERVAINVGVTVPELTVPAEPETPAEPGTPAVEPVAWIPWVVPPAGGEPTTAPGSAEMQREGGLPVPLDTTSTDAGRVTYTGTDGVTATFTGAPLTSARRGVVTGADGNVTAEVCAASLIQGQVVEVWAFTPARLVAAADVDDDGCIALVVPLGAPLDGGPAIATGPATLQFVLPMGDGQGRLGLNIGVGVGGLAPTSLPAGHGIPTGATPLGGMLAAIAAGLLVTLRRGRQGQGAVGSV